MKVFKNVFSHSTKDIGYIKIDAFVNIFLSNYTVSILIWLSLFLASCAACIYLIVMSVLEFNEYKVITTIRYFNEKKAEMPTLTFCNLNPFTSNFSLNLIEQANLTRTTNDNPVDFWKLYLQLEEYLNATRGYYLTDEEKLQLANFDQAIIPKLADSGILQQFERIFHPKYFGCLRFNSNGSQSTTSNDYFLDVTLYSSTPNPMMSKLFPANLKGFYLFIQNRFVYIFFYKLFCTTRVLELNYKSFSNIIEIEKPL